jgi:hypothetical protein
MILAWLTTLTFHYPKITTIPPNGELTFGDVLRPLRAEKDMTHEEVRLLNMSHPATLMSPGIAIASATASRRLKSGALAKKRIDGTRTHWPRKVTECG